jgi:hypothetical protein
MGALLKEKHHGPLRNHCNSGGSMARIYRLVSFFFVCFLVLTGAANAAQICYNYNNWTAPDSSTLWYSTMQAACAGAVSEYSAYNVRVNPADKGTFSLGSYSESAGCFMHVTWSGGSADWDMGKGQSKVVPCQETVTPWKTVVDSLNLIGEPLCFTGSPALSTCYAGFVITSGFSGSGSSGKSCIYPPFATTGATCAGTTLPVATPSTCKTGEVPGQVNGVDVCVKAGSTTSSDSKKTETTPITDSSGSTTSTDKTTSTETKCDGTNCTTTTTTTTTTGGGDGASGTPSTTTTTSTKPQASFCAENPASAQCVTSSFRGACSGGFSCDGDAVQCAIAQEQHVRDCQLYTLQESDGAVYDASRDKEGDQTKDLPGNSTVDLGGSVDSSDAFGGAAQCIQDLNIVVMGRSVSLPFSTICPGLAMLGNVLVAVSFLLAFRIVTRG